MSEWKPPHGKWFLGATLNVSESCLDQHLDTPVKDKRALVWEAEPEEDGKPEIRTLTYGELHAKVVAFASALASLGVGMGDRVVIYMGMVPEVVIAMLASARLGAVHSIVFGGFAAEALRHRVTDCQAKVVITQDGAYRRGNVVPMKAAVDAAVAHCLSVQHVVMFPRLGAEKCPVTMKEGRDLSWEEALAKTEGNGGENACIVDAEHPLFILYTSGSTGKPKGVLHTTGGYLAGAHVSLSGPANGSAPLPFTPHVAPRKWQGHGP